LATLETASIDDIQRLLELFPLAALKVVWDHFRGTKEEICRQAAREADYRKICAFVIANFSHCKQHSYIFNPRAEDDPPPDLAFPDADILGQRNRQSTVYLAKAKYTVLLKDPFSQEEVELLWPMRIEYREPATLISFIVLERNVKYFFEREAINVRRHLDEADVIGEVLTLGYAPLDLNRGVKALWREDYMDAFRAKFKKPRSTTTEAMDRERGIKATEPDLYAQMLRLPMYDTMFRVNPNGGNAVSMSRDSILLT
jgi:hypothetical protein